MADVLRGSAVADYALRVEIGIILTVVLVGLVAGDVALVRALARRRGGDDRDDDDR